MSSGFSEKLCQKMNQKYPNHNGEKQLRKTSKLAFGLRVRVYLRAAVPVHTHLYRRSHIHTNVHPDKWIIGFKSSLLDSS